MDRRRPGEIRDAITDYLEARGGAASLAEITSGVEERLGSAVATSSIRSYLGLNEGTTFTRVGRGRYRLRARR